MILLNSNYFKLWYDLAQLAESSKIFYKSCFKKFEKYLLIRGFREDEKLDFNRFYFIEETGEFLPIDTNFIDDFVEYLQEEGCSTRVIYNTIEALKNFFKLLKAYDKISHNPMEYYPNPFYKNVGLYELNGIFTYWGLVNNLRLQLPCQKTLIMGYLIQRNNCFF